MGRRSCKRMLYRVLYKSEELPDSSIGKWEFWAKNHKREKPKFPNLLILEHLKNHFIKPQLTK